MAELELLGRPITEFLKVIGRSELRENLQVDVVSSVREQVPEILYEFPTDEDRNSAIERGDVKELEEIESAALDPLRQLVSITSAEWGNLAAGKPMSQGHANEVSQAKRRLQYVAARATSWRLAGGGDASSESNPVAKLWPMMNAADERLQQALAARSRILMAAAAGIVALIATTLRDTSEAGAVYAWSAYLTLVSAAGAIGAGFAISVQRERDARMHANKIREAQNLHEVPEAFPAPSWLNRFQEGLVAVASIFSLVALWIRLNLDVPWPFS